MTGSDDGQLSKLSPLGGAIFNSIHWTSSPAPECPQHLAGRFPLVWIEPLAWSVIPIPAADLDCHDNDRPDLVTTHQDRLQTPIPISLAFCVDSTLSISKKPSLSRKGRLHDMSTSSPGSSCFCCCCYSSCASGITYWYWHGISATSNANAVRISASLSSSA